MKKVVIIFLIICLIPLFVNLYVILINKNNIYGIDEVNDKYDIALILGCSVLNNNEPSKMLKDRLNKGIELYNNNIVDKILITGDHREDYSEVDVMYQYLLDNNIIEEDILIDKRGYSTRDSINNYKDNYDSNTVIVVTQKYHLYRALYILKENEIDGIGVYADLKNYKGQILREIREILARNKDFIYDIFNW